MRGFKNFLMRGDVIVVAVGLVIALAFSGVITAFTANIINPIVAAAGGKTGNGLGFYVSDHNTKTFVNVGALITAIINFVIFMAVVYFVIVVPYKHVQALHPVEQDDQDRTHACQCAARDQVAAMTNTPPFLPRRYGAPTGSGATGGCSVPQYLHLEAAAGRSLDRHAGQVFTGAGSPKTTCPRRA